MSYDAYLEADCGGSEPARLDVLDLNMTYNVGPMLREAGLGSLRDLDGMCGEEASEKLGDVLLAMRADPTRYRDLEPANGWGDYDTFVRQLSELRDACGQQPAASLRIR